MIIIIATIKYGSTYYNTFTMGVCSNYHGYFFQCELIIIGIVKNAIAKKYRTMAVVNNFKTFITWQRNFLRFQLLTIKVVPALLLMNGEAVKCEFLFLICRLMNGIFVFLHV